jgi:hypothetical protein
VTAPVVAGDAGEVDAQEDLAVEDGEFVVGVELVDLRQIVAVGGFSGFTFDVFADDGVDGGDNVVALGRGDTQALHEKDVEPGAQPQAQADATGELAEALARGV